MTWTNRLDRAGRQVFACHWWPCASLCACVYCVLTTSSPTFHNAIQMFGHLVQVNSRSQRVNRTRQHKMEDAAVPQILHCQYKPNYNEQNVPRAYWTQCNWRCTIKVSHTQLMLASKNYEPQGQHRHDHALLKNKTEERACQQNGLVHTNNQAQSRLQIYSFVWHCDTDAIKAGLAKSSTSCSRHFNKYDKHSCCLICNKHFSKRQGGYRIPFQTLPPCIAALADVQSALQARQTGWKPVPHMPQSNQGSATQQSWFCQSSSTWFSRFTNSSYDCTNLL